MCDSVSPFCTVYSVVPASSSVERADDCTLLKSGAAAGASVLLAPLRTLLKSGRASPDEAPPPFSDSESGSLGFRGLLMRASCGAWRHKVSTSPVKEISRPGGRYWRGSRPAGGGGVPGVARQGLMSSPPRRV